MYATQVAKIPISMIESVEVTSDLNLLLRPLVQIDRLDLGDVDPQVPMDASTADADEDTQIPGCPSWTWWRGYMTLE